MEWIRINKDSYHVWIQTSKITKIRRDVSNEPPHRVTIELDGGTSEYYDFSSDNDALTFVYAIVG